MRDDVADDVPEEEVLLVSSAAAAPPRELLPGEGGSAATVAGAGAPALRVLPAPDKGGESWVESVFCEGTVTTGDTSVHFSAARRFGSNALGTSSDPRDSRNAIGG